MPRTCVYCRRELPPGARRCDYCGSPQPPDTTRPRRNQPGEAAPPDRSENGRTRRGQALRAEGRRALLIKVLIVALVVSLIGLGGAAALVIAQSGSAHQQQAAAPTATRASSPGSTTTSAPSATATTPGATATALPTTSCGAANNTPLTIKQLGVTDFAPTYLLPDNLSLKPTPVSQIQNGAAITPGNSLQMSVSLNLPPAPQVAAICQVSVKLVAFQALPGGSVSNVRIACDAYYANPGGPVGGGCGGGAPTDGHATIAFSSTQVGAIVTAPLVDDANQPVQISSATSGGALSVTVQVAVPGTYTFSVGLWQDNNGAKWSNLTVQQMILAGHITNYWGGQACTAAAMQSQLPTPTNPPGEFVCPGGPPQ